MSQTPTPVIRDPEKELLHYQIARMRQLVNPGGFFAAYYEAVPASKSCMDAFKKLNDEYRDYFGVDKYASWKSFQKSKNRFMKMKSI